MSHSMHQKRTSPWIKTRYMKNPVSKPAPRNNSMAEGPPKSSCHLSVKKVRWAVSQRSSATLHAVIHAPVAVPVLAFPRFLLQAHGLLLNMLARHVLPVVFANSNRAARLACFARTLQGLLSARLGPTGSTMEPGRIPQLGGQRKAVMSRSDGRAKGIGECLVDQAALPVRKP